LARADPVEMALWSHRLHPMLAGAALGFSLVVLVLGAALVPLVVARLPADYLLRETEPHVRWQGRSLQQLLLRALRNCAGALLLLAGIAMLVLPGQGILTILAGLSLLNFPGKRRIERRLLGLPGVRSIVAAIRRRAGRPPLLFERDDP
jgi:hypothetical protein